MQLLRCGKAIKPWQVNIDNRDIRVTGERSGNYVPAVLNGRYDF